MLSDAFNNPGDGFFAMRFINAAPGPAALDLYLTAPGADLSATAPGVSNITYGSSSLFLPIAIGKLFELRITPTGTKDVIYDSASQTFPPSIRAPASSPSARAAASWSMS